MSKLQSEKSTDDGLLVHGIKFRYNLLEMKNICSILRKLPKDICRDVQFLLIQSYSLECKIATNKKIVDSGQLLLILWRCPISNINYQFYNWFLALI